jgi:transcriptional regulator with XRE-family HTH domain
MNENITTIEQLRKFLGLKQSEFSKRIATTQGHISDIENRRKILSERIAKIISLEFQVNYEWLMTGKGEMFDNISEENELSRVINEIVKSDDRFVKRFLTAYWSLSKESRVVISDFMDKLAHDKKHL